MSIRSKLLAAFIITTLMPVLIIALVTIQQVNQDARDAFVEASDLDISIVDHSFTNFFNMVSYNVSFMADHPDVKDVRSGVLTTYFEEKMRPAEVAKVKGGGRGKSI
jgi:methyl-accepting chemotaxis protein